ncbi:methyltransferase-like protein 25B [Hetaerina americana]|uniref:methyltransferase-like protein 25B n=1 Tax=Hetaerina americana TaxID=62018 RepID=UPI003A7F51F8
MVSLYGSSAEKLSDSIRKCCYILQSYSWLTDAYILDFFTEDLWERLPPSWQEVLNTVDLNELGWWLDFSNAPRCQRPWPLSLLALRMAVRSISLPRRSCATLDVPNESTGRPCSRAQGLSHCGRHCLPADADYPGRQELDCSGGPAPCTFEAASDQGGFFQVFRKHVTPKKMHEIDKMAKVVCQLAADTHAMHVVDVGSGLGHLARLLSYGHGLSVCCIEAQETLSSRARKLDMEMKKALSKMLTKEQLRLLPCPQHVTSIVEPSMEKSHFVQMVSQAFQQHSMTSRLSNALSSNTGFGIVGLHPCGDLAPYLIRIFTDCPEAKFICIAGCCYMKLTPNIEFPMSAKLMDDNAVSPWQRDFQLSYESREMACHAIEAYSRNLLSGITSSLKIHCYRAALERIIVKNWPNLSRRGLKSIKYAEHLQFPEYAVRALSSLKLIPPNEDVLSEETNQCLDSWRKVVCFYSIRLMLSPLVETLILIDRFLFLSLKGMTCRISPEFDPELSPRNHLIIATKSTDVKKHLSL